MFRYAIGFLSTILIVTSGCSSFAPASLKGYPDRSGSVEAELSRLERFYKEDVIENYYKLETDAKRRTERNKLITARLHAIDLQFNQFQQALNLERTSQNIATDWAVLGLNAAGTLVPGAAVKSILAAASGGLVGAKGSFDKNAYFERTMPALFTEMEALRKSVLVRIQSGLSVGVDNYSLNQALIDLEDYFKAGTIPGAIMGIVAKAGESSSKQDEKLVKIFEKRNKGFVAEDKQTRVNQILDSIANLSAQKAIELINGLPVSNTQINKLIELRDPSKKRLEDGNVAKSLLKMAVSIGSRSEESLKAWEMAVK